MVVKMMCGLCFSLSFVDAAAMVDSQPVPGEQLLI